MGTILPDRFEPIRLLRKDRASSTFLATDRGLGRNEIIVKIIGRGHFNPDTAGLVEVFSWYRGLRHVFISEILDAGLTPKRDLFYVRAHHPPSEFFTSANTAFLKALVSAVDFLHSMGRIHGAIKPSNVFASEGNVKIADPWVGQHRADPKWPLTEEDIRFSAPEVLSGGVITVDSDLYSLGAVLYRFFSGRDPFEDSDLESLKAKYIWASPRSLLSVSHVSKSIGEIVSNLLNKDPGLRIAAFEFLKEELEVAKTSATRAPAIGLSSLVEQTLTWLVEKPRLRMTLVESPAGFGKSRFVEELQNRASLGRYMWISSGGSDGELYASLARQAVALIDEHRFGSGLASLSRLRTFVETDLQQRSKPEQDEIERDLLSALASIARRGRLFLVIEDIDRGGRKLAGLVESVVQQLSDLELSIVVTSRSDAPPKTLKMVREFLGEDYHRTSVNRLSPAASSNLRRFLSNDPGSEGFAERKAAGNPSFLEDYCKNSGQELIPKRVRKALSSILSNLPSKVRPLAEVLSVTDQPVDWSVLSKVSGISKENLREPVEYMVRSGLMDEDSLSIPYEDARNVLRSRLSKQRRTELHGLCFRHLQENNCKSDTLAAHAFHAGLYDAAANLYLQLAADSFNAKDYRGSGHYYEMVSDCRIRDHQVPSLGPADSVKLAKCYALQGHKSRAQAILKQLLGSKAVREDGELLSSIYAALASPVLGNSAQERVRLLELAIDCLSQNSLQFIHHYRALGILHLMRGDSAAAEEVLKKIEPYCSSHEDLEQMEDIRASIFMSRGKFKEAVACLSNKRFAWSTPGGVTINLAVCHEQLGDLNLARQLQITALHEAQQSGTFWFQVVSLGNLGSMETKLGNFAAAEAYFVSAHRKVAELQRKNGHSAAGRFGTIYADAAACMIQRGEYRSAKEYLACIKPEQNAALSLEIFLIALTRVELHVALGQWRQAREILKTRTVGSVSGGFFEIELLLAECQFEAPSVELSARLERALEVCRGLETTYQECRLRLALAKVLVSLGDLSGAANTAATVRRVCEERGYKILATRALFELGLATEAESEKRFALKNSLDEAADMGMTPLVAECAFKLGAWRYACGDYAEARDYLSKSISITTRLAEGLSRVDRKSYLSRPDVRKALELLKDVAGLVLSVPSRKPAALMDKESVFFARLYRLLAAMTATADVPSAMVTLLQALKDSMDHLIVLVSDVGGKQTLQPIRTSLSDELVKRITSIDTLAGERPYITGVGANRRRNTAVWMPILSFVLRGGIYVESLPDQPPLDERDIEFLTLVTTIVAAGLDRISRKAFDLELSSMDQFHGIVGSSKQIQELRASVQIASSNAATVLIEGESGTGKELVAKAIHLESSRRTALFVPVDCGALPEGLVEAELFGARKGAYTGAVDERRGLFEAAHNGTIFLDEISNLGLMAQAKLLRVLQEREVRRIGSMTGRPVDIRLMAATNCNLEKLVQEGKFRQDLLYRLKVLHIKVSPLRDRKGDIPLLAAAFLERLNALNQTKKYFGPDVIGSLSAHDYPGNVRELHNAVERAFYTARNGIISRVEFFKEVRSGDSEKVNDTANWFKDLTEGRENFWRGVHDRYKRRDIPREKVVALVDYGLRTTRGHYKTMAKMFQIPKEEYHRFMDFLRRNQCLLDFRPYRRIETGIEEA